MAVRSSDRYLALTLLLLLAFASLTHPHWEAFLFASYAMFYAMCSQDGEMKKKGSGSWRQWVSSCFVS